MLGIRRIANDALHPVMEFAHLRETGTPGANGDGLAEIIFRGTNSAASPTVFGRLLYTATDVTSGAERGEFAFEVDSDLTSILSLSRGQAVVTGTLSATVSCCPSDRRFKQNVGGLANALETIARLRGVRFDWRTEAFAKRGFSTEPQIGFIAQDLLDVVPEVVQKSSDGYYAVDYGKLTPLLVEAIKELSNRHEEREAEWTATTERLTADTSILAGENDRLHNTIDELNGRLMKLEAQVAALAAN